MIRLAIVLAAVASLGVPQTSVAQGQLSLSLIQESFITRVEVEEENGIRNGNVSWGPSVSLFRMVESPTSLRIVVGPRDQSLQVIEEQNGKQYKGFLFEDIVLSDIRVRYGQQGKWSIYGVLGKTKVYADADPVKRKLYMHWGTSTIDLKADSDGEPGACAGTYDIVNGNSRRGKLFCVSSGKLEDAFFRSPVDVIGLMVRLFVEPEKDDD
jgi:hypothetical protein